MLKGLGMVIFTQHFVKSSVIFYCCFLIFMGYPCEQIPTLCSRICKKGQKADVNQIKSGSFYSGLKLH